MESTITQFVKTHLKDKDIQNIPLPERFYEMFDIPKPTTQGINEYLMNSIKTVIRGGQEGEIRPPKDNIIRPMPFNSTIVGYDLSGNEERFVSTINVLTTPQDSKPLVLNTLFPLETQTNTILSYVETINDNDA